MKELRKKIKESGLKQTFIAAKLGISPQYLTMMLSGNATMPEHTRNEINEILAKVAA